MGALIALLFGFGLLLAWNSGPRRRPRSQERRHRFTERTQELLTRAGIESVSPAQLVALSATMGVVAFFAALVVSRSPTIALAFTIFATAAPVSGGG